MHSYCGRASCAPCGMPPRCLEAKIRDGNRLLGGKQERERAVVSCERGDFADGFGGVCLPASSALFVCWTSSAFTSGAEGKRLRVYGRSRSQCRSRRVSEWCKGGREPRLHQTVTEQLQATQVPAPAPASRCGSRLSEPRSPRTSPSVRCGGRGLQPQPESRGAILQRLTVAFGRPPAVPQGCGQLVGVRELSAARCVFGSPCLRRPGEAASLPAPGGSRQGAARFPGGARIGDSS